VGKAKAITATACKLALLVYRVLAGKLVYQDPGAVVYHQLNRVLVMRRGSAFGIETRSFHFLVLCIRV
jgi:hypothetical protein